jgi:tight adherence protein B
MFYVFLSCGFVLVFLGTALLLQGPSKEEKAALARLEVLMGDGATSIPEESLLLEIDTQKGWLERALGGVSLMKGLEDLLQQANWTISVETVLLLCFGSGFFGFLVGWLYAGGLWNELVLSLLFVPAPYFVLRYSRTRRLRAFDRALPDAIDIVQRTLRAGLSVQDAFKKVAEKAKDPVASEFHTVVVRLARGADMKTELIKLADRVPTPDLRIFVTALNVQRETGGDLPVVLDRLTRMIRTRVGLLGEMRAETAQGRLSGIVLTLIPAAIAGGLKIINPDYMAPLFHDRRGHYMLIYCVISNLLGLFFIRRITSLEV